MAEAGAVAWQFHKKGLLIVEGSHTDEDRLMTLALEAGAEDIQQTATGFEVTTDLADFEAVKEALQTAHIETSLAEVTFLPQNLVKLEERPAVQMLKLMEKLDDQEDVQKVHANFDISDEVMEKVAASE